MQASAVDTLRFPCDIRLSLSQTYYLGCCLSRVDLQHVLIPSLAIHHRYERQQY